MGSLHFIFIESITYIIIGYIYKLAVMRSPSQRAQSRIISKLVIQVIVPVLIFRNLVGMKKFPSDSWVSMLVFIALELLSALAGNIVFRKLDYKKWVTMFIVMFGFNTGIFFFPILEQIVGAEGVANLILFDIPNNLVIFTLFPCLLLYVRSKTGDDDAKVIDPPDESKSIPLDKIKSPVLRSSSVSSSPAPILLNSSPNEGSDNSSSSHIEDPHVNGPILAKHKKRSNGSNKDAEEGKMDDDDDDSKKKKQKNNHHSVTANIDDEIIDVSEHIGGDDEEVIDIVSVKSDTDSVAATATSSSATITSNNGVTLPYYMTPSSRRKAIGMKILKSITLNGPLISIVISFICFGAGLKLPTWIDNLLEKISRTLSFLGMLLMGMLLELQPRLIIKNIKWVGVTLLTRYAVGAVVALFVYFVVFPHISPATRVVALMGPFMPAPILASVFVIEHGYDPFMTSLAVNSFTVISFFIVWILFTVVDFNQGYSSSSSYSSSSMLLNMTAMSSSSSSFPLN